MTAPKTEQSTLAHAWTSAKHLFSMLAAKKIVSYAGIVIGTLAAICTTSRDNVDHVFGPDRAQAMCATLVVVGLVITGLGRGIADRRASESATRKTPQGDTEVVTEPPVAG
jgi:hypothetical protein